MLFTPVIYTVGFTKEVGISVRTSSKRKRRTGLPQWFKKNVNLAPITVWSLALEGKDDLQRFKEPDWGLRTWDTWDWNDCDRRFGDEWPGRIPGQMIAHILYYFSQQDDLVFDPMGGGGVTSE